MLAARDTETQRMWRPTRRSGGADRQEKGPEQGEKGQAKGQAAGSGACGDDEHRRPGEDQRGVCQQDPRSSRQRRGRGLALTVSAGDVVVRARPALSTVFDAHSRKVCGFCFATATSSSSTSPPTSHTLMLRKAGGRLSIFVDEKNVTFGEGALDSAASKETPVCCAVLNGCAPGSPNEGAGIQPGDVVESVCGEFMTPGKGALQRCLAALAGSNTLDGEAFPVVVRRPSFQACEKCQRFAICGACRAKGLKVWHDSHECKTYKHLPVSVTKGRPHPTHDAASQSHSWRGDWASPCPAMEGSTNVIEGQPAAATVLGDKESLAVVATLQSNKNVVPHDQKLALAGLDWCQARRCFASYWTDSRAAGILRDGLKVGCALSVFMGYCNHDCTPNAEACVDDEGFVTIKSLREISTGEEVCISYVDRNASVLDRRATLSDHYEFECRCVRCLKENREYLKAKARNRGQEYLMNNSKLARAYLHDMGGNRSNRGSSNSMKR